MRYHVSFSFFAGTRVPVLLLVFGHFEAAEACQPPFLAAGRLGLKGRLDTIDGALRAYSSTQIQQSDVATARSSATPVSLIGVLALLHPSSVKRHRKTQKMCLER